MLLVPQPKAFVVPHPFLKYRVVDMHAIGNTSTECRIIVERILPCACCPPSPRTMMRVQAGVMYAPGKVMVLDNVRGVPMDMVSYTVMFFVGLMKAAHPHVTSIKWVDLTDMTVDILAYNKIVAEFPAFTMISGIESPAIQQIRTHIM